MGLEYSFVKENRDLKKNHAVNLETIVSQASLFTDQTNLEDVHEF